jgi:YbbR domain-containing protein
VALFPRIFTKNWQLKVLAVAVAVMLWTVPRFEVQSTQVLDDIPVEVGLSDPGWTLVDLSPSTVSVTVSGPARDLIALEFNRPPVLVPVVEVSAEDTTVVLSNSWFRIPGLESVVVEQIRPPGVSLRFEEVLNRRVALYAPLYGELPDSISLAGPPEVDPVWADVMGPASRLEEVDSVRLVPINLATVTGPDTIRQPVDTAGFEGVDFITDEASVVLPIEATEEREFRELTLALPTMASDPQLQARPAVVTVVVSGAGSLLGQLNPGSIRAGIPATAATLPPGEEERILVSVVGVPPPLKYRVEPESVLLRRPVGR